MSVILFCLTSLRKEFVCRRGLLTKLLCTPYESRDEWKIAVTKYNDTFYMCEFETDEQKRHKQNETSQQKKKSYWGYKFEQYVTAS